MPRQAALLDRIIQEVSPKEQQQEEDVLKKIGKNAEALTAKKVHNVTQACSWA